MIIKNIFQKPFNIYIKLTIPVNNIPIRTYYFQPTDFIRVSRKDMLDMQYQYNVDPLGFANQRLGLIMSSTSPRLNTKKKYNPIELY